MLNSIILLFLILNAVIHRSVLSTPENESTSSSPMGPFSQLLGGTLYRWKIDEAQGVMQVEELPTDDLLKGKTAVAIYFSASWCGPCRKVSKCTADAPGLHQFLRIYDNFKPNSIVYTHLGPTVLEP
jgi:thiol-disulfide isomerase/thioredoxin